MGATFQLGRRSTSPTSASKTDARVDTGVDATKRPHIELQCKTADVRIDLHINQALAPVEEVLDAAVRADNSAYDTVWVLDHLATLRPRENTGEMLDPHVLLGAIAARTSRVRLGVLVNNVHVRPAAVIAGATATLDHVSNGRAILGLGAGAAPGTYFAAEHDALGTTLEPSIDARHQTLLDSLRTVRRIWNGDHDANVRFPKPRHDIPVVVGLNSITLAKKAAAEGCGINVRADHPRLDEILAVANRSLGDIAATVWLAFDPALRDPDHPRLRELEARGVTHVMLLTTTRNDLLNA